MTPSKEENPMTPDEARAELLDDLTEAIRESFAPETPYNDVVRWVSRAGQAALGAIAARPELVLAALGAKPVTTAVAAGEDGNWTEEDQPAWCNNCEEYGWGRPVVMLPEGTEKP